jgi:crossover junction endodeoxyribonuclease RusA
VTEPTAAQPWTVTPAWTPDQNHGRVSVGDGRVPAFAVVLVASFRAKLYLPYGRPPKSLVGNSRAHWRRRSADTQQVRSDVMRLAQNAGLHRLGPIEHIAVELVWAPGDRRRRDADNLWPLLKASCDALARGRRDWIGLDLVPDDTPAFMEKLAPRIEPPPAKGMWLLLTLTLAKETQ